MATTFIGLAFREVEWRARRPAPLVERFRNTFTWSSATALGRDGSQTRPYKAYRVVHGLIMPRLICQGICETIY